MTDVPKLALKGSSKVVADYFEFAINSILFQRGIYPPEDFKTVRKYDLPLLITADDEVQDYINKIMTHVKKWLYGKKLLKLVVVLVAKSTADVVERWEFNLQILESENVKVSKPKEDILKEIQAIIRQISTLVSYLPVLKNDDYTFNVLVYTDPNHDTRTIPREWCDTEGDGRYVLGDSVESVKFKSFSTDIHQVGTLVSYKLQDS